MSEREQIIPEEYQQPLNTFRVSSTALEVRNINRYLDGKPVWGNRIALYAPETVDEDVIAPSEAMWKVFDIVNDQSASVTNIAEQTNLPVEDVQRTIDVLSKRLIVLPTNKSTEVISNHNLSESGELYIETTEACNFSCGGCATGIDRYHRGEALSMTNETLQFVLEETFKSAKEHGMKSLKVKWAGGESLLPLSVRLIEKGQIVLEELKEKYPEIDVNQVLLTNGTFLTDENVEKLKKWNTEVSVSLWGLGQKNNLLRGARREQDTFENIVAGLKKLHDNDIPFGVHHVVSPQNAHDFGKFLTAFWDTESDTFIGKNWDWKDGEPKPIRVGITFYRAQTLLDIQMMQQVGYNLMVDGIRGGFATITDMISRGIPIRSLNQIDYLQLFGIVPTPCGSGFGYVAAGPRGFAPCHEGLFNMSENLSSVREGADVINLINSEYYDRNKLVGINMEYKGIEDRTSTILALHGGTGCPRTSRDENDGQLGHAASTAKQLYAPIVEELISLEVMRRLKEAEINGGLNLRTVV